MEKCSIVPPAKLRYMIELKLSDHVIDMLLQNPGQIITGCGIERNVKIKPAGKSSTPATECFERDGNQFKQVGLVVKKAADYSEDLDSSLKDSLAEITKEEKQKMSQKKTIGTGKVSLATGKRKRQSNVAPQPRKMVARETSKAKPPTRVQPTIENLRIHLISILANNEPVSIQKIFDKSYDCPSRKIHPILKQIGTIDRNECWYLDIKKITDADLQDRNLSVADRKNLTALKRVQIKKDQEEERRREKEKRKQEREKVEKAKAAAEAKRKPPVSQRPSVASFNVPEEDKATKELIMEYETLKKKFDQQYHMYIERRNYVEGNAANARRLEKKWMDEKSDKGKKDALAREIASLHKDKYDKVCLQAKMCSDVVPHLHKLREELDVLSLNIVLAYKKQAEALKGTL